MHLSYPLTPPSLAPYDSNGTTGSDGVAHLRGAPYGDVGVKMEANARGYLYEEKYVKVAEVEAIEPAHWFEDVDRRPACFVVEMYAEPHPTVELVVPKDYRGRIKAEFHIQEDALGQPGQRCFRYAVPASGVVQVTGPPLLHRIYGPDFRARFADGEPLSGDVQGLDVGFWWLKCEGDCHYLLVGTRGQFDDFRRSHEKISSGDSEPSHGGKGGGRGKRGRGGSQASDAPSDGASP